MHERLSRSIPDPYRPLRLLIPLLEWLPEWLVSPVRKDGVHLLKMRALGRVLDLGCGTGGVSRRLAKAGLWPVALDASPTLLASAVAKTRHPPTFPVVLGDARHIPFKRSFDAVILSLALHEMDQKSGEAVWAEMERVLRPGGVMLLVDFILPEKSHFRAKWARSLIRLMEYLMGQIHPPHYLNYVAFIKGGGLSTWVFSHGAVILEERHYALGNLALLAVGRA